MIDTAAIAMPAVRRIAAATPAADDDLRTQPPIWLIERPGRMKLTWPMR
jgi:hypothetical protein